MKRLIFVSALIFFGLMPLNIATVSAIEYGGLGGKPANPDANNPRTSSIFIFELTPESSDENELLVVNNTAETKTILVYATDSQKSTDGSFACEQYSDTKDSVGSWIKLEKEELTLEPSTNETIKFTITAPLNASVGEENGCIMIQEKKEGTDEDASGVSLSFRTGLRVIVTIPGEQIRELEIKGLEVDKKDKGITGATLSIENTGNVSIDTNVKVKMDYFFGVNNFLIDSDYPILRGETSVYNFEIPKPFWGGFYKIYATAEYDQSDEASVGVDSENPNTIIESNSKTIFIMPSLPALIIELIAILGLPGVILFIIFKSRKFKKMKKEWVDYKVKAGEDINSISDKNGITWKLLVKVNNLKAPYQLTENQIIKTPSKK